MKIIIEIPKDFKQHWKQDRFFDSMSRILTDVSNSEWDVSKLAGCYEEEMIEMLREAFLNAEEQEE